MLNYIEQPVGRLNHVEREALSDNNEQVVLHYALTSSHSNLANSTVAVREDRVLHLH